MRTISENLLNRLQAQAEESEVLGIDKVAKSLTNQIEKVGVRKDSETYFYNQEQLKADVEENLWNSFVRIADYFDTSIDPVIAQKVVEKYASDLINELTIVSGKIVGEYEKNLPGEQKILEVEEK